MALFIVMEFMSTDLHKHLHGKPLESQEIRGLGFQLMRAMAQLYGQKICHRDVKPENVLLGPAGECVLPGALCIRSLKLADFGSAKALTSVPSTSYICARWWRAP